MKFPTWSIKAKPRLLSVRLLSCFAGMDSEALLIHRRLSLNAGQLGGCDSAALPGVFASIALADSHSKHTKTFEDTLYPVSPLFLAE